MGSWNPFSSPRHSRSSSRARSSAGSAYSSASRHYSSTSRYRRSPRHNYIEHLYAKLRHFLRELYAYARRHPYKVFFVVIMPLVSGGLLHRLAKQFGVTLPGNPSGGYSSGGGYLGGGHSGGYESARSGGGGYYGSEGYGPERGGASSASAWPGGWDMQSVAGGIGTAAGTIGSLASLAKMASQFMHE